LRRRPRSKLGCGAKERRKKKKDEMDGHVVHMGEMSNAAITQP
jgi:hypothetical protein